MYKLASYIHIQEEGATASTRATFSAIGLFTLVRGLGRVPSPVSAETWHQHNHTPHAGADEVAMGTLTIKPGSAVPTTGYVCVCVWCVLCVCCVLRLCIFVCVCVRV